MSEIGQEKLNQWAKEQAGKERQEETAGGKKYPFGVKITRLRLYKAFSGLSFGGVVVYIALSTYADQKGLCWPSRRLLAGGLGRHKDTIGKMIKELEQKGFLKIRTKRGKGGKRHEY